ncbi:type I secretion C-terminal target domain-containing protein [Kiloniella antarctica]|uniref:Type I secretion C-terminal target domain-containing protein n=1 Tax=Kiloniella antarctica TaxID=1550907 RepID=A0ABW5BIX5_9PROT
MTQVTSETVSSNFSGEMGQDQLVGQSLATVDVTAPAAGETINVVLTKGQTANLNFDATGATPVIEGNNFVLTFDNNGDGSADSRIVFENLVEASQGADGPVLIIGGIELSAGLLIGQAQALNAGETLETAAGAGAGPQGGGGSTYDDETGDLVDLLEAQDTLGGTELDFNLLAGADEQTLAALDDAPVNNGAPPVNVKVHEDALKGANAEGGEGGETQVSEISITAEALAATVDAGDDGLGGFDFNENVSGDTGVTSQGEVVTYKVITDGTGAVIAVQGVAGSGDGERVVFELTKDGDDFNFALKDQIDHTPNIPANDDGQSLDLDISGAFKAFDSDGDEVVLETAVTVTIEDDVPVALADSASVAGTGTDTTVTGNVLDNDGVGADGGKVTSITFDGKEHAVAADGVTEIIGENGTLQISADGSYSYTASGYQAGGDFSVGRSGTGGRSSDWGEVKLYAYGKDDTPDFDALANTGANVTFGSRGVGVSGGSPAPTQINHDAVTGNSEKLIIDLQADATSATVRVSNLYKTESTGEQGRWTAYDSEGNAVATGLLNDTTISYSDSNVGTATIDTGGATFQYLVMDATGYAGDGNRRGDSSDYFVRQVTFKTDEDGAGTDIFTYQVTDGDGDTASSTLSLTVDGSSADYSTATAGIQAFLDYDGGPVGGANAPTGGANNSEIKGKVGLSKELVSDDSLEGVDDLVATDFGDYVYGSAADNQISLGGGNDTFDDRYNGSGNDTVDGGSGNDRMWTGDGEDTLIGGIGNDILSGESGNDLLIGGEGDDLLIGGSGADTYKFSADDIGGTDTINGFSTGQGDILDLSELLIDNGSLAGAGNDAELATALDDYLNISVAGGKTTITVDQDGISGGGDTATIVLNTAGFGSSEADVIKSLLDHDSLDVIS